MFQATLEVTYRDRTTRTVTVDQWAMAQYARYTRAHGYTVDPGNPGMDAIEMVRFWAWAELHRDPNTVRPSFDTWDQTVADVSQVDDVGEPVDPTGPVSLAG